MAIENKYYRLITHETIQEIEGDAFHYEHIESGMQVVFLKNTDKHKAFSVSFPTPPQDDTGVCHILEHSVCCASEKYHLKDTFMSLDQGSVNTALNACTYKDMTMFYGASLNDQDINNILDVYMDLVFHPLIYKQPLFFKQEAWHYELEALDEPLSYNGIVYNEMQGEYSEISTWFDYEMHRALFPDTFYQYDSGGVPEHIVTLTECDLLRYHRAYYTHSNAYLCLYGDYEIPAMLTQLHEQYLKGAKRTDQPVITFYQEPLQEPLFVTKTYPTENKQLVGTKTLLGLSFVVGDALDTELRLAFQMLEHMLLKSAASPLAAVLIEEAKIGKVLGDSGYDPGKYQPTFSITLHDCSDYEQKNFENRVLSTLQALVENGIPTDLVDAAYNTVAFGLFEGDNSGEPKGVLYTEDVALSLLYGGDAFAHLKYQMHLKSLYKKKNTGYFEKLIQTYLLDNTHRICLALKPSYEQFQAQEDANAIRLEKVKKSLSQEAKEVLIRQTLEEEEAIVHNNTACLPTLNKSSLQQTPEYIKYTETKEEGIPFIWHENTTKGIHYVHFLFDTRAVPVEDSHYVGLLAHILTYIRTTDYEQDALENKINKETGGLNCSLNAYHTPQGYIPYFKISAKVFAEKITSLTDLLVEILTQTCFDEKEKIYDLIQVIRHEYEKSFTGAPEYRATKRCYSYFTQVGLYEDRVAGLSFYDYITHLCEHYEQLFTLTANKLKEVYQLMFMKQQLLVSVTCDATHKEIVKEELLKGIRQLPEQQHSIQYDYTLTPLQRSEGFMTTTQVQALAKGMLLPDGKENFTGSMYVASHLINAHYLWEEVRLNGGAYGADMAISREGHMMLVSYCDPHLEETLVIFDQIGKYLQNLDLSQEELDRSIVGTVGNLDYPSTMEQKSEQVIVKYLSGLTNKQLLQERKQVFDTTLEDLQAIGRLLNDLPFYLCCIGNSNSIQEAETYFTHLTTIQF